MNRTPEIAHFSRAGSSENFTSTVPRGSSSDALLIGPVPKSPTAAANTNRSRIAHPTLSNRHCASGTEIFVQVETANSFQSLSFNMAQLDRLRDPGESRFSPLVISEFSVLPVMPLVREGANRGEVESGGSAAAIVGSRAITPPVKRPPKPVVKFGVARRGDRF